MRPRQQCEHERQTYMLGTISATLWLGVIGLLVADLDGTVPGIVVVLIAIVAAVTTTVTVQVWTLDRVNACQPITIQSGGRGRPGTITRSSWAVAPRSALDESTIQLPRQLTGGAAVLVQRPATRDQAYWDSTADIFATLLEERDDDPQPL